MDINGTCHILYCLDLARGIDLTSAQERLTSWRRASFHHKSRVLTGDAVLPPLRVRIDAEAPSAGKWRADPQVELALYDQGVLCVTWSMAIDGPLDELVELSSLLYDNADLKARARKLAQDLATSLGPAMERPFLSEQVEDYVVFAIPAPEGDLEPWVAGAGATLARVLRAEPDPLSPQEIEDALSDRVAYRASEVCFIDWLGAFLVGTDTEDERLVLELANVELLELRLLDAQLDVEIVEAYRMMGRRPRLLEALTNQTPELQRVGRMQADGAVLHEGIGNALKLLGDDYLARLYRTAAERFHYRDWDGSIERKLGFLRNAYQSLADVASHRRSEILEWIIIVLIAVDIILYFTPLR